MNQHIGALSLLVREYDEAIDFYTRQVGFALLEDSVLSPEKRWVRVAPIGTSGTCLLLARAVNAAQIAGIGHQGAGRVWLFLHSDDFWRDYHGMQERGVHFCETPREELYGTVAVWQDLYGNRWDLLQLHS